MTLFVKKDVQALCEKGGFNSSHKSKSNMNMSESMEVKSVYMD